MIRLAEELLRRPEGRHRGGDVPCAAALERGGDDPLALAIYGHGLSLLLKDYATALTYLDRAIEAGPKLGDGVVVE